MCTVYVFLFVLEMFKYIELVYLFSVLEVFSAWRLKNQFLFTTVPDVLKNLEGR